MTCPFANGIVTGRQHENDIERELGQFLQKKSECFSDQRDGFPDFCQNRRIHILWNT